MTAEEYAAYQVLPNGGIKTPTPFWQMVPREKVVNMPALQQLAYSRVDPEVTRLRNVAYGDLMSNLASTGGLRFGTSGLKRQQLNDAYARQREEMAQPFVTEGARRLSDYYNEMEQDYYRDPNTFQFNPIDIKQFLGY